MFKEELLVAEAAPLYSVVRDSMEVSASWEEVPLFDDPLY